MRDAKTIGFSIGSRNTEQSKAGISRKLELFDLRMRKYYNYIISDTIYNGIDCYVFNISVKKNISKNEIEKTLIRKIVSYFDKKTFNVIYREYKFVFDNWLIDLDIDILVEMDYVNKKHVPRKIIYDGYWNALFFKPERSFFKLINTNYNVE